MLAVRPDGEVGGQRQPDHQSQEEIRADLHITALLPRQAPLDGPLQEHGPRQELAAVPVLLQGLQGSLQPGQARQDHQGQRAGGPVRRRPRQGRVQPQDRFLHPGKQAKLRGL